MQRIEREKWKMKPQKGLCVPTDTRTSLNECNEVVNVENSCVQKKKENKKRKERESLKETD